MMCKMGDEMRNECHAHSVTLCFIEERYWEGEMG